MWFGTFDGLNRYDGYTFKVYTNDPFDSTTISDNVITCIFEDSKNQIWIGTVNGYLNKFNRNTESFERYFIKDYFKTELDPPGDYHKYPLAFSRNMNVSITSIAEDHFGYLWITTWGYGVLRYDPLNDVALHLYHQENDINSLSFNRTTIVIPARDGTIWIGTLGSGLDKLTLNNQPEGNGSLFTFTHYKKYTG